MENIKIGTFVTDITAPLEAGILMSSVKQLYEPFKAIRLPLKCRILVIEHSDDLFAIVALDLLGVNHTAVSGWDRFKKAIAGRVEADKIIITCTHTHSSPDATGLTDLYKTEVFKGWLKDVEANIKNAIDAALENLEAVTVAIGTSTLEGFSLQRRVRVNGEVILSDAIQPINSKLFKEGPIDRRVRKIEFTNLAGQIVTTIGHAVCHPVHEMCSSYMSPDFPGEFCLYIENRGKAGVPLFLNGCCGDINPPTVSMGSVYARQHGQAIAEKVINANNNDVVASPVRLVSKNISAAIRKGSDVADEKNGIIRLNALRLGDIAIVFLPGEPFTTTALEIEQDSPFPVTMVVGYSENYVGYIPTKKIFNEGGYETGPGRWSYLEKDTEAKIRTEIKKILLQLHRFEEPEELDVL